MHKLFRAIPNMTSTVRHVRVYAFNESLQVWSDSESTGLHGDKAGD